MGAAIGLTAAEGLSTADHVEAAKFALTEHAFLLWRVTARAVARTPLTHARGIRRATTGAVNPSRLASGAATVTASAGPLHETGITG